MDFQRCNLCTGLYCGFLALAMMTMGICSVLAEDAVKQYKVDFLNCWQGSSGNFPDDQENNMSAKFIRENFGITLKMADNGGTMNEIEYLNMMFSAGTVPDVVNCAYWGDYAGGEGITIINAAKEGLVKDIAPYLVDYPNLQASYGEHVSATTKKALLFNEGYPEGAKYFVPSVNANPSELASVYGDTLYARQDVLEAVGVRAEDVTNMDQVYDLLKKIKEEGVTDFSGNPIIPLGTHEGGWRQWDIFEWLNGNQLTEWRQLEDGSVVYYVFTDYVKARINYMRTLLTEGLMDIEAMTQTGEVADAKIVQGRYGVMAIDKGAAVTYYYDLDTGKEHPEAKWVPLNLSNKDGNMCVDTYQPGFTGGHITFFSADIAEDKLRAILSLMEWLCTEEGMLFNAYGIEGETFEMINGIPMFLPELQAQFDEDIKVKHNLGIMQFEKFQSQFKAESLWPKTQDQLTAREVYDNELSAFFRPRVEIDKMPVTELLKQYEGYDRLMEDMNSMGIGDLIDRAYYYETDEEVDKLIEDMRTHLVAIGIEDAHSYIEENLTDEYAF